MDDLQKLLSVFDAYVAATGCAEATASSRFLMRGGRIADLRRGGDMGSRTIRKAIEAFSANWPENAEWPEGVARPAPPERAEDAA